MAGTQDAGRANAPLKLTTSQLSKLPTKKNMKHLLLAIALLTNLVHAEPLADLSGGQVGRIEFNSITPPNRFEYARKWMENTKTVTIYADLILPSNIPAETKVPVVVLSHGSGGIESDMFNVWAKQLNAIGYAVFIPDFYKPRGVIATNGNQEAVPYPSDVADTLNALRMLATHPQIDASRIYNMGFSRGGTTAFDTAWPTWQRPIDTNGVKFAGHIVWYPGNCDVRYRTDNVEKTTAPMMVLLPDRDKEEGQDVAVCERYFDELIGKGNNIIYKQYKGARHAFDSLNTNYRWNPKTTIVKDCDMEVFMRQGGQPIFTDGFDYKKKEVIGSGKDIVSSLKSCLTFGGGSRGGSPEIQRQAVGDAIAFLQGLK